MPADPRTARARGAERPIGAYVLIAGLAVLALFASAWTILGNRVDDRGAQLHRVNAEANVAEARTAGASKYQEFAELARNRVATVTSLSATRFDWAHALHEISRVLPRDAWLMQLSGTSGAAGSEPTPGTSAAPAPSFEIQGCTRSQAQVARLMARMRAVDGVRSVELRSSTKPDTGGSDQCPANRPSDPVFTIVVKFAAPGESKPAIDDTGQVSAVTAPDPAASTAAASETSGDSGSAAKSNATSSVNDSTKGAG